MAPGNPAEPAGEAVATGPIQLNKCEAPFHFITLTACKALLECTMKSKPNNANWLNEHLSYEIQLMRFSFAQIRKVHSANEWDAFYASFVVHARNLYHFLTNEGGYSNYKASDFVPSFKATKNSTTIKANLKLHSEVLHLGKTRSGNSREKLNLRDCSKLNDWLENQLEIFLGKLSEPCRSLGQPAELVDPTANFIRTSF